MRSGWVPAAVVVAVVLALQVLSGTSVRDLGAFALYALLCIVVPGTLLWRRLEPVAPGRWVADVVFGAILGYAIEIPAYLAARAFGVPMLVLAWPAAVYAYALVTRRGRALWRPDDRERCTVAWSWSLAGIVTYLVLFVARANWWVAGVDGERLRVIGPDASFQLALTGELRHHLPPVIPWVADEPLHYHWLTYVHTASATWLTAAEPIVMLRRLAPLLLAILVVLATALVADRLVRRHGIALLAASLLVLVHSPAFHAAEKDHFQRQEFTSASIFGSPTMTYGTLLFCGVLLLVLEILHDQRTVKTSTWVLLAAFMAVTAGAKATFAPMTAAGAMGVVAVALVTRDAKRRHFLLATLSVLVWLGFQLWFYGGESSGARLTPRGTFEFAAPSFGAVVPEPATTAGVVLATVILLLWTAHMAGMLVLLPEGGWRQPVTAFLLAFTVSGLAASLMIAIPAASQQWFVASTQVPTAVGAALGLSRLVPVGHLRRALPVLVPAVIVAMFGMAFGWLSSPTAVPTPGPTTSRLWEYAAPFLITTGVLVVVAVLVRLRRVRVGVPFAGLTFVVVGLTSLGLFRTLQLGVALGQVPWQREELPPPQQVAVGEGGIEAARWLRSHSSPADVLATNGHAMTPASDLKLRFWLAGYAERRVLVESWGYTPRHSRLMSETGLDFATVPFWDPEKLAANDKAFTSPDPALLHRLGTEYDVSWLVLDRRFPSDPDGLSSLIPPAFAQGDYVVYDLESWVS